MIDRFQHQGVGRTLLWLCALSAVRREVRAFRVWMLGENRAAMSMLRTLARVEGHWESGVYVSTTPLPDEAGLLAAPPALDLVPSPATAGATRSVSPSSSSGKADA